MIRDILGVSVEAGDIIAHSSIGGMDLRVVCEVFDRGLVLLRRRGENIYRNNSVCCGSRCMVVTKMIEDVIARGDQDSETADLWSIKQMIDLGTPVDSRTDYSFFDCRID